MGDAVVLAGAEEGLGLNGAGLNKPVRQVVDTDTDVDVDVVDSEDEANEDEAIGGVDEESLGGEDMKD